MLSLPSSPFLFLLVLGSGKLHCNPCPSNEASVLGHCYTTTIHDYYHHELHTIRRYVFLHTALLVSMHIIYVYSYPYFI